MQINRVIRRLVLIIIILGITYDLAYPQAKKIPVGIRIPPSINFATPPSFVGSGARAWGMGTSFIAIADDATAASHNPAGLIQLKRPELSMVGAYNDFRMQVDNINIPDILKADEDFDDLNINYISAVYPFSIFRRNAVVSLNFQRLMDLEGNTDVSYRFQTIDGIQIVRSKQRGVLETISPAFAIQITPRLSLGATLNFWNDGLVDDHWGQSTRVSASGYIVSGNTIRPFTSSGFVKDKFDLEGWNFNLGFRWKINETFTLGSVVKTPFRSRIEQKTESFLSVNLAGIERPILGGSSFSETLHMRMPLSYGLGLAVRFSDSFTTSLDWFRTEWSDFKLGASSNPDPIIEETGAPAGRGRAVFSGKANPSNQIRLGAEYLLIKEWGIVPFRLGLFYDPEPSEESPDDFFGFSFGSGIARGRFAFDFALTFRFGDVTSKPVSEDVRQFQFLTSFIYYF